MRRQHAGRGQRVGAGGERLHPFQRLARGDHRVRDVVAERDDDFEIGDHGVGLLGVMHGMEDDRGKAPRQTVAVLLGVHVENENLAVNVAILRARSGDNGASARARSSRRSGRRARRHTAETRPCRFPAARACRIASSSNAIHFHSLTSVGSGCTGPSWLPPNTCTTSFSISPSEHRRAVVQHEQRFERAGDAHLLREPPMRGVGDAFARQRMRAAGIGPQPAGMILGRVPALQQELAVGIAHQRRDGAMAQPAPVGVELCRRCRPRTSSASTRMTGSCVGRGRHRCARLREQPAIAFQSDLQPSARSRRSAWPRRQWSGDGR